MLTIKQSVDLSFHHVDIKDAIVMLSLMNKLSKYIAENAARKIRNEMPDEASKLYKMMYGNNIYLEADEAKAIFDILSNIGFVATEEYSAEDILEKYLKKD